LEEVAIHSGHEVLAIIMEVDNNCGLICWRPARDFRPAAKTSTNPLMKYYYNYIYYLLNSMIKLMKIPSEFKNRWQANCLVS
jgi:hypothetical protein